MLSSDEWSSRHAGGSFGDDHARGADLRVAFGRRNTMKARKLARTLVGLGVLVVASALIWWIYFYSQMSREIRVDLKHFLQCMFATSYECAFVDDLASSDGMIPYNPAALWVGVATLTVGLILGFSPEKKAEE
jgi:hypothetical protein